MLWILFPRPLRRRRAVLQLSLIGLFVPVVACVSVGQTRLVTEATWETAALDERFTLLTWNIGKEPHYLADLDVRDHRADVVCLQEWADSLEPPAVLDGFGGYFGCAWRYPWSGGTGVATFSGVEPLETPTTLLSDYREFYVASPKAVLCATYPVRGCVEPLLVVNVHALNYQLTLSLLRSQMREVGEHLAGHAGPVVVCGDFNTWRGDRLALVQDTLGRHGLEPVPVDGHSGVADWIVTLVGGSRAIPLNHVFTRGLVLEGVTAEVLDVVDTEHRPIRATFRVQRPSAAPASAQVALVSAR